MVGTINVYSYQPTIQQVTGETFFFTIILIEKWLYGLFFLQFVQHLFEVRKFCHFQS